jgi:hypothetical protein
MRLHHSPDYYFCDGPGCGPGGGGCRQRRGESCTGELAPVCGCNDRSYANPCWAREAGVRIAHEDECPE